MVRHRTTATPLVILSLSKGAPSEVEGQSRYGVDRLSTSRVLVLVRPFGRVAYAVIAVG